jgi:hypothetical protein
LNEPKKRPIFIKVLFSAKGNYISVFSTTFKETVSQTPNLNFSNNILSNHHKFAYLCYDISN